MIDIIRVSVDEILSGSMIIYFNAVGTFKKTLKTQQFKKNIENFLIEQNYARLVLISNSLLFINKYISSTFFETSTS